MITILEGASGSGKSYQLYNRIIRQSMEAPDKKFFLVVPEQFTMQAQRDIVSLHPRHGTMNIDIVSFNRLAYRVFEEQNVRCDRVLEDFGKSMLLQRILLEYRKELPVFGPSHNKTGFIDELKSLLTELFQYRIGEQELEEFHDKLSGNSMLKNKLHDLLFVYRKFQDEIKDKYIIAEHILEMLASRVPQSQLLAGSELFLDGYTGFTPIQYELLEALAGVADNMTITVTIDRVSAQKDVLSEHELFYLSKDTIHRINRLGERLGIFVEEEYLEGEAPRFTNAQEIAHLEKNIFRYPYDTWECSCCQIHIQEMKNTREELRSVARQIHAMVREGRYRYKDIAIIHGNVEELFPIAEEILPQLDIPYFIDANQSLYMNPFLESMRALLDVAEQDYSFDSVFRFLKTGITELEADGIEQLENYCRKTGIRGEIWWNRVFTKESDQTYPEGHDMRIVMNYGIQAVTLLESYVRDLKNAVSVSDYVRVLQRYLEENHIEQKLADAEQRFEEQGDYVQAKSYRQVYERLQDILGKMDAILGTEGMKTDEFHILLDTGLNDIALGVIPPSPDQLTIGDIERTRLNHIKVLFVMGMNDGIIPKVSRGAGILSELDRSILAQDIELAPDSRQQVFTEQFYLYQNITKASGELFLTYHSQDSDGNEALPAYLIGRVKRIFPNLSEEYPSVSDIAWDAVETPADSRELLVTNMHAENTELSNSEKEIWKALYQYYSKTFPSLLERIEEGINYNNIGQLITPETAGRLYGDFLNTSVSKLETYSKCPYQFFLEYGLKLRKREKNEVSLMDMGNLLHKVVECVFRSVETRDATLIPTTDDEQMNPWEAVSDEELREMVEKEVDDIAASDDNQIYRQTYANRHLLKRIRETAAYAVVDLKQQLLTGKMIPYQFELVFNRKNADDLCKNLHSVEMTLENGSLMKLNGVVDRIDICRDEENVYVKVLDYKSSRKELEMTQVSAGLQLQLLIYTNVVMEVLKRQFPDKRIIPAGSLYYGFKIPMVPKAARDETTLRNIAKGTSMTGLVNEDEPCVPYMGAIEVLPAKAKKNAEDTDILTTDKYMELLSQAQDTAKTLGDDMLRGEIPIRPVKSGRGLPCDYCSYKDVCKLDVKDGGNQIISAEQLMKSRNKRKEEQNPIKEGDAG